MAAPVLQLSVLAAFISAVRGYAVADFPTQNVGYGAHSMQEPTEAPSMELLKRRLERRDLVNTCTEWSILGGWY